MIKSKNKFFNYIILLVLVPMLLLSLFGVFSKNKIKSVYAADFVVTDYSFIGSNIFIPATMLSLSNRAYDRNCLLNLSFTFSCNQGVYSARIDGYVNATPSIDSVQDVSGSYSNLSLFDTEYDLPVTSASTYGMHVVIDRNGNITSNIQKVVLSSSIDGGSVYNYVSYYDDLGNSISFRFEIWIRSDTFSTNFRFQERTYYINLGYLSNNTYYESGYNDGYNQGITDGSESGYDDGYSAGNTVGYNNGYNAGVADGGNYSFASLIGAVIDAPVSSFTSLLNFEILGVNILGFICGLLTLAIILFIIKLCMGGK